jgi:hypothetical protein
MASLGRNGFFGRAATDRTCVLVTDGETRTDVVAGTNGVCRLVIVRVGGTADRIYRRDGSVVADYRPEADAAATLERLARLSGGSAYGEGDIGAAGDAVVRAAERGPTARVGVRSDSTSLAPLLAALATACVAGLFALRYRAVLTLRGPYPTG